MPDQSQGRRNAEVWVHDETTFVTDEHGEPLFLQGVMYDVTERKLARRALRESEQREREAARDACARSTR